MIVTNVNLRCLVALVGQICPDLAGEFIFTGNEGSQRKHLIFDNKTSLNPVPVIMNLRFSFGLQNRIDFVSSNHGRG